MRLKLPIFLPGEGRMEQAGYEELKLHKNYRINPKTGSLINRAGKELGAKQNAGYLLAHIPGHKKFLLHRLVYTHCHGTIPKGLVIDHMDGNKNNNSIDNLQAITCSANIKKAYEGKDLTGIVQPPQKVIAINITTKEEKEYPSLRQACLKLGIATSSVRYCIDGKCKTALSKVDGSRYGFRAVTSQPSPPPPSAQAPSSESSLPLPSA